MNLERDRFVAFAFAAADAFLEIDRQGKIKFAAGALDWLAGQNGSDLIGRDLDGYCNGRSRKILRAAAESAKTRGRFGPITVRFRSKEGVDRPIAVYGTHLPQYPDSTFLSLKATSLLSLNMANVSRHSLTNDRFVTDLIELLQRCEGFRDRLIFEVTDATEITDLEVMGRVLSKISRLGHPVCLDDFGIGEQGYPDR